MLNDVLYKDARVYAQDLLDIRKTKVRVNKTLYFVLNISSAFFAFASATLIALIFSKIFFSKWPEWYFFASAGTSAFITLLSSVVNYFTVKDNMIKYRHEIKLIEREIFKYEHRMGKLYANKDKDFFLYANVASIVGSREAKKEVDINE